MKRVFIAASLAMALMVSSVVIITERAEAHPALILGIVAWKVVAIAATGIIAGSLFARATQNAQAAPRNCVRHISRRTGNIYYTCV